jgi:hypothetical protein
LFPGQLTAQSPPPVEKKSKYWCNGLIRVFFEKNDYTTMLG